MAYTYVSGIVTNQNVGQTALPVGNAQIIVGTHAEVIATTGAGIGIITTGSTNTINVLGTVFGSTNAISMGGTGTETDNSLFVGEDGYINGALNNAAVKIGGLNSFVRNEGHIWNGYAGGTGIDFFSNIGEYQGKIVNSGTIDTKGTAINVNTIEWLVIENSGTIRSQSAAVQANGTGNVDIRNTGNIFGNVELGSGNDSFDTGFGKLSGSVYGQGGNDVMYGSKGGDTFDGGDGNDELNGYTGDDILNGVGGDDFVFGGNGNDSIDGGTGNNALYGDAGNDVIIGGAGKDNIFGGTGIDNMTGGAGADIFVFSPGYTGKTQATADVITDFNAVDDINLKSIDANTKLATDQKFSFISTQAFHGKAGELRFEKLASDTYIYGDTNGDKKADLVIHLDDAYTMKADYFVL